MVRFGPKPKKLDAAICKVLVMNGGPVCVLAFAFNSGDVVPNAVGHGTPDRAAELGGLAFGVFFRVHFGRFDTDRCRDLGDAIAEIFGNSEVVPNLNASPSSSTSLAVKAPWS